jgi:hypothetical protein
VQFHLELQLLICASHTRIRKMASRQSPSVHASPRSARATPFFSRTVAAQLKGTAPLFVGVGVFFLFIAVPFHFPSPYCESGESGESGDPAASGCLPCPLNAHCHGGGFVCGPETAEVGGACASNETVALANELASAITGGGLRRVSAVIAATNRSGGDLNDALALNGYFSFSGLIFRSYAPARFALVLAGVPIVIAGVAFVAEMGV